MESDMGVRLEKPDNLIWVEQVNRLYKYTQRHLKSKILNGDHDQVIMNNLETSYDPTMEVESSSSGPDNPLREQHDLKLMIAEIEMRDESYFGDDRISTLSRLVTSRIKYLVGF